MASQDVTISQYKRSILVTGNTFSIKGTLKSLGGSWNKPLKGWNFRPRDREAVVAGLRALPGIAVTDQTAHGAPGGGATIVAAEVDDYSDLAANSFPNKGTFGESGVPGERMAAQSYIRHHPIFGVGGRTIESTKHGDVFEMRSRRESEKRDAEDQEEDDYGGGGMSWVPKISIEGRRHKPYTRTDDFICDGTMYRHTVMSWEDAPVKFKRSHEVEASRKAPVRSTCYEHKIEDSTPFSCDVYWETVWEKCPECEEADQSFKRWATRASNPAAMAAEKKRKADEAASATASASADVADSQGGAKTQKTRPSSSSSAVAESSSSSSSSSSTVAFAAAYRDQDATSQE